MEKLDTMCDENVHLDEGLATEILVRLPAKSVLRFRAVCKEWRRITARPAFLAEHARRRPLEVLLYTRTTVGPNAVAHLELGSLSVTALRPATQQPLARFPDSVNAGNEFRQYCHLLGSCDGLLLFRIGRAAANVTKQYLVCNPATRQWSDLPRLTTPAGLVVQQELGFYFHEPTGEYRLLSYVSVKEQHFCVFSTGAEEPRLLSVQDTTFYMGGFNGQMAQGILHGHLHWLDHMTRQMLAFDTVAETFRWMPPPPVTRSWETNLFVVDGSLVAWEILLGQPLVDLWVLEGYGGTAESWERRHRVRVNGVEVLCATRLHKLQLAAGGDGVDVLLGTHGGVVAYDMRSGTVRKVVGVEASSGGDPVLPWRSVFRESLVRHGFFQARPHPGLPLFSFLT